MKHNGTRSGIWLLLILVIFGIIIGKEWEWGVVLVAAFLHECGHYWAARLCGTKVSGFYGNLLGARMQLEGVVSYGREAWIAWGGPAVNLLCWGILTLSGKGVALSDTWILFRDISLGLGILNLFPIGTMDGGRILTAVLSYWFSPELANKCRFMTTVVSAGILWMFAVYAILRGVPILSSGIFFFMLLWRCVLPSEQENTS